jgi:hypothetical protein
MRRYAVTEAPRTILVHELGELIRREEHLNPDRPERAEAYRHALAEIEMGAPAAMAWHTEFRINDECSSRYGVTEGTAAEIIGVLNEYHADRELQGKREKARRFADARDAIEGGDDKVRVEHVVYRVVED